MTDTTEKLHLDSTSQQSLSKIATYTTIFAVLNSIILVLTIMAGINTDEDKSSIFISIALSIVTIIILFLFSENTKKAIKEKDEIATEKSFLFLAVFFIINLVAMIMTLTLLIVTYILESL